MGRSSLAYPGVYGERLCACCRRIYTAHGYKNCDACLAAAKRRRVERLEAPASTKKPSARRRVERLEAPASTKKPSARRRVCLSCGAAFDSTWIGNRICTRCKASAAFAVGAE